MQFDEMLTLCGEQEEWLSHRVGTEHGPRWRPHLEVAAVGTIFCRLPEYNWIPSGQYPPHISVHGQG